MKIFRMEAKKLSLRLVIVFAAAALVSGIFLLASGLPRSIRNGEDWPPMRGTAESGITIDESREYPAAEIDEISIQLRFEDAVITPISGDVVTVRYHGTANTERKTEEVFFTELSGGVLTMESQWGNIPVQNSRITLELGIPSGTLDKLTLDGSSGKYSVSGLNLDSLDINGSSGNILVQDISAGSAVVKLSSGSITAEGWRVGSGEIKAVSGNLDLKSFSSGDVLELSVSSGSINGEDIAASKISGRVVSGRIRLKGVSGNLSMKSSSGSINVEFRNPGDEIYLKASSGQLSVGFPRGTVFRLNADASSGNISSDFAVTVAGSMKKNHLEGMVGNAGSGENRSVELSSSSGNITIKELGSE
ncbi:MAG: hypothetical protein DRP60_06725 [Spirochaetes bacterium]|nr:MAG: hypothetical protein DRP60_06725 [Spirochaetota bacterium]